VEQNVVTKIMPQVLVREVVVVVVVGMGMAVA
jgi:hypothetical protein